MAAPGYPEIIADINENIKPVATGGPRYNSAATVRALLLRVVGWISSVYDACANYGSLYAVDGTVTSDRTVNVNGKRLKWTNVAGWQVDGTGYWATVATDPNNSAPTTYYPLLTLPASAGNVLDFVKLMAVVGSWTASQRQQLNLYMGNRDGFSYSYTNEGPDVPSRIEAYQNAQGLTTVYAVLTNNYQMARVGVPLSYQANLVDGLSVQANVSGTKVFDSSNPTTYPPVLAVSAAMMKIAGFLRTGAGNKAFKVTGVKTGTGLTLKTTRYLELLLEDGTIVKVAEVN